MNLPFFIAKRYLVSKKSHNAINIISGISVGGISIGTMALVIVLSIFNGLSSLVQSLYNSFDADIEITIKQGKTFFPNTSEFQSLKKIEGVAYYNEVIAGNALLKYDDKQCIATIKGVSAGFEKMSRIDTLTREGDFNINKNNIVIGKGISYVLQSRPGDLSSLISIYAPKRGKINSLNPEDGLNEIKAYPAGVFSLNEEFDNYLIMNIDRARELLDYTTEVTSLELGIKKGSDIEKVRKEIAAILGDKYEIKNREQQNATLYKTMQSEKLWTFIILIFILIIATFNVIGSLTMLIIEKKKDISILHHMGADIKLIRKIFLVEGMLITFIGTIFGLLIGTFLCWIQMTFEVISISEGLVVNAYPIKVEAFDILMIMIAALSIGFIAAWYPVRIFTKRHLAF
ncbi:MAG: FtsX-like permease family protein [Bacteroidetes bacterium]|nr:FtsX-like permease family protein [Bacteroidota bacterium]